MSTFNFRLHKKAQSALPYGEPGLSPPEDGINMDNAPVAGPLARDRQGFWNQFDNWVQQYDLQSELSVFMGEREVFPDIGMNVKLAFDFMNQTEAEMPDWAANYCTGHDFQPARVGYGLACTVCGMYWEPDTEQMDV